MEAPRQFDSTAKKRSPRPEAHLLSRESLEVVREFKAMGLVEGVHFAVRWSGERGFVSPLAEGVRRLAWL